MKKDNNKRPECFGDLDVVFPEVEDGFRASPGKCWDCSLKTDCLRTAMQGRQGLRMREACVDKAYASGQMSFWERWSQKKTLSRERKSGRTKPC